jgi:hypothetical protein
MKMFMVVTNNADKSCIKILFKAVGVDLHVSEFNHNVIYMNFLTCYNIALCSEWYEVDSDFKYLGITVTEFIKN